VIPLPVYRDSFFTGPDRKDGLGLVMEYDGRAVRCRVYVDNRFQGYVNVVHGGIIMGILDRLAWYAVLMGTKKICRLHRTEMEYLKPVMCNTVYQAKAHLLSSAAGGLVAHASIQDMKGEVCSRLAGFFEEAKGIEAARLAGKLSFRQCGQDIKELFGPLTEVP
jgi:acyl-coenzyme A thioesterase PaaI-like protein